MFDKDISLNCRIGVFVISFDFELFIITFITLLNLNNMQITALCRLTNKNTYDIGACWKDNLY